MYELIPEELKKLNHWICWKAEASPKAHSGINKVPINPNRPHCHASTSKPETWSDFKTAEMVAQSNEIAGIGFVFTDSGYFGIDIDDRPEELQTYLDGNADDSNLFFRFIETLQSYAELSQSGKRENITLFRLKGIANINAVLVIMLLDALKRKSSATSTTIRNYWKELNSK